MQNECGEVNVREEAGQGRDSSCDQRNLGVKVPRASVLKDF